MTRQYNRVMALQLIKPVPTVDAFFQQLPNAVTITQLNVKFKISKSLSKKPDKASVTITNLAEATRSQVEKKPLIVRLAVGYVDDPNLEQIFSGDLRVGDTSHEGPYNQTRLDMGDGDRAYQFGHVSRSFGAGSRVIDAVSEMSKALGLQAPPGLSQIRALQGDFPNGITLHGPAQKEMGKVLTPLGLSWSMQDGKLILLTDKQPLDTQAIVISEDTGMVGSPKIGPPKKPGETNSLKVKKLIDARIVPGCKIEMRSRDVKGLFRVEKLDHSGEFRGKEWYTDIDARQL